MIVWMGCVCLCETFFFLKAHMLVTGPYRR